ncbi:CopY/TcrY family copper transport repressor [Apilactobacillus sp. TMW 2.2459]|uniref:CopY/TcrY family copper transport repressor n=1 Tax=Apilactobacillus xinyiensis TaxID=2841032 RepID=UPI002010C700|nr:CopY/TcrY family copper transport repressor [Apilactobacillus xinyiensis]MCL0312571.1 CopY/TcrY family copper transport repressor [Apilactobacillus xinyiensis]
MPKDVTSEITSAEWEVMRIVWTLKQTDSKTIIDVLSDKKGWSPSTIKTLVSRLVKKKILSAQKHKSKNIYFANIEEKDASNLMAINSVENICCMRQGTVIKYLINHLDISKPDIDDLIKTLENKRTNAKKKVNCDCLNCDREVLK